MDVSEIKTNANTKSTESEKSVKSKGSRPPTKPRGLIYPKYVPSPRHQLQSHGDKKSSVHVIRHPTLDRMRRENNYNPSKFNSSLLQEARYFVMKSYDEFDIHTSLKYSVWSSTGPGNNILNKAFMEQEGKGPVYLFFSVSGSKHFYGLAQMVSPMDYNVSLPIWSVPSLWKGQCKVKWMYVKDIPNSYLEHIRLENNENKPVTHSRDAQELLKEAGEMVLEVIHAFPHKTCIFDDFLYYEKRLHEADKTPLYDPEGKRSG